MVLETKVINTNLYYSLDQQTTIDFYSCFGWQTIGVTDTRVTMNRDNNINHYLELVALEKDFTRHLNLMNAAFLKSKFVFKIFLILFLLLIFPGILYIINIKKWEKVFFKEKELMVNTTEKTRVLFYTDN
ncbi:hypothetical protein ACJA27_00425 [Mycoplasmopsis lipophila]|uniref:hypothetical protein n=1 Tax=Mycoplasmopsis lipophila TaxID=2117 RepID=UPI003873BA16